ncbi:MAG: adenine phosphoribosyltransferase [Holosporales bacterium]|jgi:adenine phosphoribosyltransferase
MNLKKHITEVPDFPKPGILFYDISTILSHAPAWKYTIDALTEVIAPNKPNALAAIESRGFLLAAPLAYHLGLGFIMIRKKNKLPGRTVSYTYDLEYGTDTLEVQKDAVAPGQKIVLVDDLLATGGTLSAAIKLLRQCGAEVPLAAGLIELTFLKGRERIGVPFHSLLQYDQ